MEDLSARLEQLLSDPQMLSQLGELAAGLGLGNGPPPPPQEPAGEAPLPLISPPFWGCGRHRQQYPVPRLRSRPVGPHRPGDVLPFYPGPAIPSF